MEDLNNSENVDLENSLKKGLLQYDDDNKQSLYKIFGIEMTAPKGLKNPRLIYISFISRVSFRVYEHTSLFH